MPLRQLVRKKKLFEYFSMYFFASNTEASVVGPSWNLRPSFGKGLLGSATECQAPEAFGSEEDPPPFVYLFLCFSMI